MYKGEARKLLQKKKIESENKPLFKEKKVNLFIDYWELKGLRKSKRYTKQTQRNATFVRKLLRGTLYNDTIFENKFGYKKFTFDDFILAVNRFNLACINFNYAPADKKYIKKTSLSEFLFNGFAKQEIIQSYFLHFLQQEPLQIAGDLDCKNPILAKKIFNKYCEDILQDTVVPADLSFPVKNRLLKASDRLIIYFKVNRDLLNLKTPTLDQMVKFLFQAVHKYSHKDKEITAGFFSSDLTFSERLPRYMIVKGFQKLTKKSKKKKQLGRLL